MMLFVFMGVNPIAGGPPVVKDKPWVASRSLTTGVSTSAGGCMNTKNITPVAPHNTFEALDIALRAAGAAIALVDKAPPKLRSLADQVVRSASSVPANLAEGHGRIGRARLNHYRIAYGSAKEVDVHLRILLSAGAIDHSRSQETLELFDRVRAMIWRLVHPRG
jgi:four helix bundle protein